MGSLAKKFKGFNRDYSFLHIRWLLTSEHVIYRRNYTMIMLEFPVVAHALMITIADKISRVTSIVPLKVLPAL